MAENQKLPLFASGNPAYTPVPAIEQQLNFAPPPAQPMGSDLAGVLANLGALAANVVAATQRRGEAPGQALQQFGAQQLAQSAANKKQSQENTSLEEEGRAVVKRAKAAGISDAAFQQVRALAEQRNPSAARTELDRELSLMRQRDREAKAEKAAYTSEVAEAQRQANASLKSHPGALSDFLSRMADSVKDGEKSGNLIARLKSQASKEGIRIQDKDAKAFARQLLAANSEALSSRKRGGFLGFGQEDVPQEEWLSTAQAFEKGLDDVSRGDRDSFRTLREQKKELDEIQARLRSKDQKRVAEGVQRLQALYAGERPKSAQEMKPVSAPPASESKQAAPQPPKPKQGGTVLFSKKANAYFEQLPNGQVVPLK